MVSIGAQRIGGPAAPATLARAIALSVTARPAAMAGFPDAIGDDRSVSVLVPQVDAPVRRVLDHRVVVPAMRALPEMP